MLKIDREMIFCCNQILAEPDRVAKSEFEIDGIKMMVAVKTIGHNDRIYSHREIFKIFIGADAEHAARKMSKAGRDLDRFLSEQEKSIDAPFSRGAPFFKKPWSAIIDLTQADQWSHFSDFGKWRAARWIIQKGFF
jgi:hypothetical protein